MTDTNTLAPCPFCGERAETDFIPEHHSYQIACSDSIGCTARITRDSELGAIEAWNCRAALAAPAPTQAGEGEYPAGTGNPEADRIIGRLASSDPDFDDCADAVALIHKLVAEIKGPDGFDTWKDAAIANRAARGAAQAQDARQPLTDDQILSALDADIAEMQNAKQDAESWAVIVKMTRAIEAAHGIAAQQGDAA